MRSQTEWFIIIISTCGMTRHFNTPWDVGGLNSPEVRGCDEGESLRNRILVDRSRCGRGALLQVKACINVSTCKCTMNYQKNSAANTTAVPIANTRRTAKRITTATVGFPSAMTIITHLLKLSQNNLPLALPLSHAICANLAHTPPVQTSPATLR